MEAVGRWDHGHPYKFSYALTLTMTVFLLMLGPIGSWSLSLEVSGNISNPCRGLFHSPSATYAVFAIFGFDFVPWKCFIV